MQLMPRPAASDHLARHHSRSSRLRSSLDSTQSHIASVTVIQRLTLVAGPVARSSTRPRGVARPPMPGAAGAAAEEVAGPRARYRAASRAAPRARGRDRAASCCRWGLHGDKPNGRDSMKPGRLEYN